MNLFQKIVDFFSPQQEILKIKIGYTYKQKTAKGEISYLVHDIKGSSVVYEQTQPNGKTKLVCDSLQSFEERDIKEVKKETTEFQLHQTMLII